MLTNPAVRLTPPRDRPFKLNDGRGLYLLVTPNGGRYWRFKYRFAKKEHLLALGTTEELTLAQARAAGDEARRLLKSGVDPSAQKRRVKQTSAIANATSFEAVAKEWFANSKKGWTARHAGYVERRMRDDLFPDLGARPIAELEALEVLAVLRKIEVRGAHEMARRGLQYVGRVMRYAIATGRAKRDLAADLIDALETAPREQHLAALKPTDLKTFFEKLAKYDGHPATALAIRLLMLTGVRTSELIGARWAEFTKDEWRIPAERMKMRAEHIVPLSRQATAVLDKLRPISGACELVFPSVRSERRPMSNNTILYALYRMGYHSRATGHGMRSLFSTVLNEQLRFPADVIERQLAHVPTGVRAAYNRAEWLPERRKMMQSWGDYLAKYSKV